MGYDRPKIVELKRISDPRGNLAVVEQGEGLAFAPVRCYWLNDVPCGKMREGHAYHRSRELIVALAGTFRVTVTDSNGMTAEYTLSRSDRGLLLPPMAWRQLHDFATNSVGLIIASTPYDESDYIRSREEFNHLTSKEVHK